MIALYIAVIWQGNVMKFWQKGRVDRFLQINQKWKASDYALPHAATTYHIRSISLCVTVGPGPSQNRACAIYAHGSSHSIHRFPNILTIIRGFGSGNRFSIALNSSQLRHLLFPLRFNHLNSNLFTACSNRIMPR